MPGDKDKKKKKHKKSKHHSDSSSASEEEWEEKTEEVPKKKHSKGKEDKDRKRHSKDEEAMSSKAKEPRKEEGPENKPAGESSEIPEIHSANNWEAVDLGDQERKAKFLRLMGGAKKEHSGRIVIGENPSKAKEAQSIRSADPGRKLESELEEQYKTTMQNHLKHRDARHRGLGYSGASTASLGGGVEENAQWEPPAEHVHDVGKDGKVHFISADHKKNIDL